MAHKPDFVGAGTGAPALPRPACNSRRKGKKFGNTSKGNSTCPSRLRRGRVGTGQHRVGGGVNGSGSGRSQRNGSHGYEDGLIHP
jgi:hypothetical protein